MKKNVLSSSIALILTGSTLALAGCGGSSSSTPEKAPEKSAEVTNGNILCIDENNNVQCDISEVQKISAAAGNIPSTLRSTEFRTLLQLENGSVLVAPAGAPHISAYSTLVNNELLFNPTINADTNKAAEYLTSKNIPTELNAAQMAAFNTSLAAALKVNESAHPFQAIAAVSDQIISRAEFAVTVTEDNIITQAAAKRAVTFSDKTLTWELGDHDESPIAATLLEGRDLAVIATKYHNNIVVINTLTDETLQKTAFAEVAGDRYAIDAKSGASEKPFNDMKASADAQSVYISVEGKGDTDNAQAGLYRVNINNDGSISAIDSPDTKFYAHEHIGEFFVLDDGNVLIEDTDSDSIITLNSALESREDETDNIAGTYLDAISAFYPASDGQSIYAVIAGDDNTATTLNRYDISGDGDVKTHSLNLESDLNGFKFFANGEKALAYNSNGYALIINLADLSIVKTLDLEGAQIASAAVSGNGKFAALGGRSNNKLMIFDLLSFESSPATSITVENRIRALTMNHDGLVLAAGGHPGAFAYLDTPIIGSVLAPAELIALDKKALTEEFINNGQDLSLVVNNLNMPSSIPSGAGTDITWSSSTSAIATTAIAATDVSDGTDIGDVIRPAEGDITAATITANLNYQFRDNNPETDSLSLSLNIRKAPMTLTGSESLSATDNYLYYMDTNTTGSSAIAVFSKAYSFNVLSRTNEGTLSYLLGKNDSENNRTHQDFPSEFEKSQPVGSQYLDENHVLIAFPSGKNADDENTFGALVTYDVAAENLVTTDEFTRTPLPTITRLNGNLKAISHINNKHLAIIEEVAVEGEDAVRNAVIYTVDGAALTEIKRFPIASDASAIEVDSTGDSVFVISAGAVSKFSQGTTEAVATTQNEFAPYVLAISDEVIYSASSDGKLLGFQQADLTESLAFNTGYAERTRTLDIVANQAHMSISGVGYAVIDLTTEQGSEQSLFVHSRQRRAATSGDGQWAFTAQYISRSENTFQLIKLK